MTSNYYCITSMEKANEAWETKPQTATIISLRFWGLLTCAPLYCDWSLHNKPACQNEIKVFTERTWNASPPSILKNKVKAKHHILPFSGSAHHIPVHSSLILAHFSVFQYHSSSFGIRSSRHQGVSPPTNSPPRNHLATNQLATKH